MTTYKSPIDSMWIQQPSAASANTPPQYPYNNATQTESGHLYEMDDTPGQERIRMQHGKTGTFFEMAPNGDHTVKIQGDGYEIIAGAKNVTITGVCNITINGDCNMEVFGNKNELIHGNYDLEVVGDMHLRCKGDADIGSDNNLTLVASETGSGDLFLSALTNLHLSSDLFVDGTIHCDMLNADSRVNAGMGVGAGLAGVFSEGPIISLESVTAPFGTFGTMDAVLMTDVINTGIYDAHIHMSPKGPTSPPLTPFLGV